MIAEAIVPAADVARKSDIEKLRADMFRWGLAAFIPLWIGVWGAFITLLVAVLTHRF